MAIDSGLMNYEFIYIFSPIEFYSEYMGIDSGEEFIYSEILTNPLQINYNYDI